MKDREPPRYYVWTHDLQHPYAEAEIVDRVTGDNIASFLSGKTAEAVAKWMNDTNYEEPYDEEG